MKNINASKKMYDKLEKMYLPNEVLNTESQILLYTFKGKEKILKHLYNVSGEYFANKLYTVQMLDACKEYLPSTFVIPDYLFSINHECVGFTVPKIEGVPLSIILKDKKIGVSEKIDYLKKIGGILKQLEGTRKYTNLKEIYINDINESNFIVNPKNREIYIIDLDSCKIANNKIFPARYLSRDYLLKAVPTKYHSNPNYTYSIEDEKNYYLTEGKYIPDNNTDLYCYTMIIMNYLLDTNITLYNLDEFYTYLNYLQSIKIDSELIDCFANLIDIPDNINPVNLLDSLTEENIYKSKEKYIN